MKVITALSLPKLLSTAALLCAAGASNAAIVVQSLGTVAPPGTLGSYTMTAFGDDGLPVFTDITSLASPLGGSLGFSVPLDTREIGNGWATWSHGYTGDVYASGSATSVTISLPTDTGAFYLYAEPDPFDLYDITITADDGTTLTQNVQGDSGAAGWGFYGTGSSKILSITVSSSAAFGIGEFGIAAAGQVPTPGTLSLLGLAALGLAASRRRAG